MWAHEALLPASEPTEAWEGPKPVSLSRRGSVLMCALCPEEQKNAEEVAGGLRNPLPVLSI